MALEIAKDAVLALAEDVKRKAASLSSVPTQDEGWIAFRQAASKLVDSTESPVEIIGRMRFMPHQNAALRIALEAEWLQVLSDGKPKTAKEISSKTGADASLIVRILRILVASNVVTETNADTYAATPVVIFLVQNQGAIDGVKSIYDSCVAALADLPEFLADRGFKTPEEPINGPHVFTYGKELWKILEEQPARRAVFDSAMTGRMIGRSNWVDMIPADSATGQALRSSKEEILFVDVGGGRGHDLIDLIARRNTSAGHLILQDTPGVLALIDSSWKTKFDPMVYDFFTPQPVKGALFYHFHSILHDWPDNYCRKILTNTVSAMKKGYSRVLIREMVLPDKGASVFEACLDLTMLISFTGMERARKDWAELLDSVGLHLEQVWISEDTAKGIPAECLIEAALKA